MGGWTIAWTNAALSAGALAIVVPYLIHLITKRTPRTMVFPTIQFLKRAQASQSRLFRLRNLMLLLVRTAFIALLLLAFLKPVLRATAMAEDGERTQAAIIIIDASLSMKYNANGITPYQRAQRAVSDLLDLLGSGTPKNLIIAGGVPLPSLESPSTNGAPLVRDLLSTAPIDMRADIDAAIDEAVRQLEQYSDHDRTIYFVSDFQRTNWAAAQFDAIPEDIKFVFSPVGEQDASNLAVTEVMLRPKSPVVTEIVEIVCTVANYGPAPVELPVSLTLEPIGDRPTRSAEETDTLHRTLSLASGSTGSVSFRLRATDTGAFEGRVQIPDDLLNADNQRYFVFEVQDQIDVLLVSEASAAARSGAYFVLRALDPYALQPTEPGLRASSIKTRVVRARDLDLAASVPHVLVLDGAGPLSVAAAEQIGDYLSSGGALVYFLSDLLDKSNLEAIAAGSDGPLLMPFSLTSLIDHRAIDDDTHATLANANFDEPLLRRFRDNRDLAELAFYRYFATNREEGRGQVFARYSDGNFALGRGSLGTGGILFCNFSAARDASDIAARPTFIPLVHEIIKSMRPREGTVTNAVLGGTVSGAVTIGAAETGIEYFAPSGNVVNAATDRRGERLSVVISSTEELGFYRIRQGNQHLGSLPVNVDARESDLLPLSKQELEQLAATPERRIATAGGRSSDSMAALMQGFAIWPYLLVGAICVLGIEQLLLSVLRK